MSMGGRVSAEGEEVASEEGGRRAEGGRAEETPRKGVNGRGAEGFIVSVGPMEETERGAEVGACGVDEEEEREAKGGTNLREEGGRGVDGLAEAVGVVLPSFSSLRFSPTTEEEEEEATRSGVLSPDRSSLFLVALARPKAADASYFFFGMLTAAVSLISICAGELGIVACADGWLLGPEEPCVPERRGPANARLPEEAGTPTLPPRS